MKQIFILFLFIVYSFSSIITNDDCGMNCKWQFNNETGLLEIIGTGEMKSTEESVTPFGEYTTQITKIIIHEGITTIGKYFFATLYNLKTVSLPQSMKKINQYAFYQAFSMDTINFPDNIISVGEYAFAQCTSLKTISIPPSLVSLSSYFCSSCASLEEVVFHDQFLIINEYAFMGCNSLKTITIPPSVTYIGIGAFSYCYSLPKISIPEKISEIPIDFCLHCSSLVDLTIPSTVKKIMANAFAYSTNLMSISLPGSIEQIDKTAFYKCHSLETFLYKGSQSPKCGEKVFYGTRVSIVNTYTDYNSDQFCGITTKKSITPKQTSDQINENNMKILTISLSVIGSVFGLIIIVGIAVIVYAVVVFRKDKLFRELDDNKKKLVVQA